MRLLLDTHVLLWWLAADRISTEAAQAVGAADSEVWVSAASVWELSIKAALGKLDVPDDLPDQLAHHGFSLLPLGLPHALGVRSLPPLHADTFDRVLVVQAQAEGLTLVTHDARIQQYDVPVLRA